MFDGSSWPTYRSLPKTSVGLATSVHTVLYSQLIAMCWLLGAARAARGAPLARGATPAANRPTTANKDLTRLMIPSFELSRLGSWRRQPRPGATDPNHGKPMKRLSQ